MSKSSVVFGIVIVFVVTACARPDSGSSSELIYYDQGEAEQILEEIDSSILQESSISPSGSGVIPSANLPWTEPVDTDQAIAGTEIEDSGYEIVTSADIRSFGEAKKADITISPYQQGGKLFGVAKGDDGKSKILGSCTAQFVADNNTLLTAAHCLYDEDTGDAHPYLVFFQAYDDGSFGDSFVVTCGREHGKWKERAYDLKKYKKWERYPFDYAFLHTNRSSKSGAIPIRPNPLLPWYHSIGYPSNFDDGKHMYQVTGSAGRDGDGLVEMYSNPFDDGASGGAWIDDTGHAVGLNAAIVGDSFDNLKISDRIVSPIFDSETTALLQAVQTECQ